MWIVILFCFFFFSSRRRHTRLQGDWSSDVCSSDLDQRFRDSGSHGAETRGTLNADVLEGVHDSPDRPEKADEWRAAPGRGQNREKRLQALVLSDGGELEDPADLLHAAPDRRVREGSGHHRIPSVLRAQGLRGQLTEARFEKGNERAAGEPIAAIAHVGQIPGLIEGLQKSPAVARRAPVVTEALDHDGPGKEREPEQNNEDEFRDGTRGRDEIEEASLKSLQDQTGGGHAEARWSQAFLRREARHTLKCSGQAPTGGAARGVTFHSRAPTYHTEIGKSNFVIPKGIG